MNSLFRPIYPIRLLLVRNVASRKARHQAAEDLGTLSRSGKKNLDIIAVQNRLPDDADGYDKQIFDIKPRKNEYYYKYEIKNNARKGKNGLRKALELFQQMKSEDRLTPHFDHFTVLIYGCAKAGQTKLAFDLYDEGLKYFKRPSPAMVTCLINACAECPFPDYGIERLDWFRAHLKARYNFEMRDIHYHCLMKSYGKLGRIDLAVKVMQEMVEAGIQPTTDSFNMLMIGCASQKDTGALLALRIYKRMRLFEIKPNSITYNNFLRCIHYCGMGSPELLRQTLVELPAMTSFEQRIAYKSLKKKRPIRDAHKEFDWLPSILGLTSSIKSAIETKVNTQESQDVKLIEDGKTLVETSQSPNDHEQGTAIQESFLKEHNYDLPNLLSDDHLNLMQRIQAIQFDKLKCGIARFQLFGGAQGFLDIMKRDGCEPDIRILTRLCSIVEPDESGILPAFHLVKEYPVKRGELFYNNLIKSICSYYNNWKRMDLALSFLEEMHRDGIRPSVETFESLAPACDSMAQALTIIEDIERCGFVVSDELVDQLIRCAIRRKDFGYMIGMIEICRNKFTNFLPSRQLLEHLEATIVKVNHTLVQHEKGNLSTVPHWIKQDNIAKFDDLKKLLGKWLKSVETQEEEHPWKQYDVKKEAKRQGFVDYAREFQALERVKKEAQERGEEYGNLYAKVRGLSERN